MNLILLSLLFSCLFGFLSIVIINFSLYLWESDRVNNLTQKIGRFQDSILDKNNVSREFTSNDWKESLNQSLFKAGEAYEKTLVKVQSEDYPNWLKFILKEFENLRNYTWQSVQRLWNYLLKLTRPADHITEQEEGDSLDKDSKKQEIDDLVDKVIQENQNKPEITPKDGVGEENSKQLTTTESEVLDIQESSETGDLDLKEGSSQATIGLAASENPKGDKLFEKLEAKILKRLKEDGLNHYDIWLELGILYEKYNEIEKAKEIYALVMKQSEGEEKQQAKNRLIGIS